MAKSLSGRKCPFATASIAVRYQATANAPKLLATASPLMEPQRALHGASQQRPDRSTGPHRLTVFATGGEHEGKFF